MSIVEEELGESETRREVGGKGVEGEGEEVGQESDDDDEIYEPEQYSVTERSSMARKAIEWTHEFFTVMLFDNIRKLQTPPWPAFSLNDLTQVASIHISKLDLIHSQRLVSSGCHFEYVECKKTHSLRTRVC